MIGRAPMIVPPQYVSPPMQSYPGPQYGQMQQMPQQWPPPRVQPPPRFQPPPAAAQQPQVKPLLAMGQQQPVQPMVARAKPYDDPPLPAIRPMTSNNVKPRPLSLPSPQELGVVPSGPAPVAAKVDWNAVHDSLERVGGTGFQVAKLPDGRCRVAFVLATNQPDQLHHVEATAATEAEAVSAALAQAQQWASARP